MNDYPNTNVDPRQIRLKESLEGDWEYKCEVTSQACFAGDEIMRGGTMNFKVFIDWTGISADIEAFRLWTKKKGAKNAFKLKKRVAWKSKGIATLRKDVLFFSYQAFGSGSKGDTRDIFRMTPEFSLEIGKFEHRRSDGVEVTGDVYLRKMENKNNLKWLPQGVE